MKINKLFGAFLCLLLCLVLQASSLSFLVGAKLALPLLALKLHLLGPLKIAAMSKAGVLLGLTGTALGLKNLQHNKKNDHQDFYSFEHGGYRKKRSIGNHFIGTNEAFEHIRKSDPSKCTERLLCELSYKSRYQERMDDDEVAILSLVRSNERTRKSSAQALFQRAVDLGARGESCNTSYRSCQYNGQELMTLIRIFGPGFESETADELEKFVRS